MEKLGICHQEQRLSAAQLEEYAAMFALLLGKEGAGCRPDHAFWAELPDDGRGRPRCHGGGVARALRRVLLWVCSNGGRAKPQNCSVEHARA
jgi:hypothetical protein